jgi:acyl-CoA oxidase
LQVSKCDALLQRATASGLASELAWNSVTVQLVEAAEAHCRAFMVERYVEALQTRMSHLSPELRTVMRQLCELYCVFWVLRCSGDFLQVRNVLHTRDGAI